jgi:hypothetical protein
MYKVSVSKTGETEKMELTCQAEEQMQKDMGLHNKVN